MAKIRQPFDDREVPSEYVPERPGLRFGMSEVMGLVALVAGILTVSRQSTVMAALLGFWGLPMLLTWHRAGRRRREQRPMTLGDLIADFATMVALILGIVLILAILAGIVLGYFYYLGWKLLRL